MNVAQFFVERRQVGWVALLATLVWGAVAWQRMPQRKDPEVVIKTAVVTTAWPGAAAQDVEQLVTRPIERLAAQVGRVDRVTSTTRTGISTVFVTLDDKARRSDLEPAWADLRARLDVLAKTLPTGSQVPTLNTHFGDTATVVWSLASPPTPDLALEVRAAAMSKVLSEHRRQRDPAIARAATIFVPASGMAKQVVDGAAQRLLAMGSQRGAFRDGAVVWGASFVAVDYQPGPAAALAQLQQDFEREVMGGEPAHPDVWGPIAVGDVGELPAALRKAARDKYSWRELDDFSAVLRDAAARLPEVARVDRSAVVPERVYLWYSQERLAALGLSPRQVADALRSRGSIQPAGAMGTGQLNLLIEPGTSFAAVQEILDSIVGTGRDGRPIHLRDVVQVQRAYESPASDASWLSWRDQHGQWQRTRSVAVAVQARPGVQAVALGQRLEQLLAELGDRLPDDLVVARTSDQPELVQEKISEFTRSLLEAIALVIAVALVFMERRSALLVAASIPLTLAMTFGFMDLLGLDLQQVSIAALIIALGLLVDDPVIASDAINREIAHGVPRRQAAWQGPTKLAKAILFATLTNIVAFAPLLLVSGTMGEFIYGLPMVVSLSLVSSRIVSMTFMPMLGYYLLRGQAGYEAALQGSGRAARLARQYNALTEWMLDHKGKTLLAFAVFLVVGLLPATQIKTQFFPEEAMARFYIHVRLPEGADVRATQAVAEQAWQELRRSEGERLERVTTFVGNGGPRWWSNVAPEPKNPAYALLIVQARDPEATRPMIARIQRHLSQTVAGARFEVYRVSSGKPAVTPVEVRVSGPDIAVLRQLAEQVKRALRDTGRTTEVADDWGGDVLQIKAAVDDERASALAVSRADVANSTMTALAGATVTQLRDQDHLIDVVLRLQPSARGQASLLADLLVWSGRSGRGVPIQQVARLEKAMQPQKIVRFGQERTITVAALPRDGDLASQVLRDARPALAAVPLPPGYWLSDGGELEQQQKAFATVSIALKVSVALIFLVLVWQFASVFKPLIVFAAIPFGLVGVVLGLTATGTHFGFMAFLGVASLIGVIVSHIIVLFDFIEEAREHGAPLHRAVIDAGLVRLRPVLVTVLATVGGLIPLALEGGPMWRQLVYVQIGGLLLATVVTKGVVPVLYVVFVESLGLIAWRPESGEDHASS